MAAEEKSLVRWTEVVDHPGLYMRVEQPMDDSKNIEAVSDRIKSMRAQLRALVAEANRVEPV